MPIIKSAKKKLRQDLKRTKQNQKIENLLKTAIKQVKKLKTKDALQKAQSIIDKAAKKILFIKIKLLESKPELQNFSPPLKHH